MKRDWECVRQILLQLEALGDSTSVLCAGQIPGFDEQNVTYQMQLLSEAGLIEADCTSGLGGSGFGMASRLTWQGHELLDNMRDQGMWNNIRKTIREKGLEVSVEAIKLAGKLIIQRVLS